PDQLEMHHLLPEHLGKRLPDQLEMHHLLPEHLGKRL
mgnify:CR=1